MYIYMQRKVIKFEKRLKDERIRTYWIVPNPLGVSLGSIEKVELSKSHFSAVSSLSKRRRALFGVSKMLGTVKVDDRGGVNGNILRGGVDNPVDGIDLTGDSSNFTGVNCRCCCADFLGVSMPRVVEGTVESSSSFAALDLVGVVLLLVILRFT